jgi:N-glycosylase/DNA lyase
MRNRTVSLKTIEKEILDIHANIAGTIEARLREFRSIGEKGSDNDLFIELVFCLFTPQSSARRCWRALENLLQKGFLFNGCFADICRELVIVRFRNNKTRYLLEARELFLSPKSRSIRDMLIGCSDVMEMREWLSKNVKGLGYKEASHFLRNIGKGDDIAILDRHILKSMRYLGLIKEIPKSLPPMRYRVMERILRDYSKKVSIPLNHLDFVLWYKETGDIFK